MAGEKIKVLAGKPINIRATAVADVSEGDYVMLARQGRNNNQFGGTAGFWLHDTKKDEVGDVCISVAVAEIPNTAGENGVAAALKAGEVFTAGYDGIEFGEGLSTSNKRTLYRNSTYTAAIIYEDTPATSDRVKVVWGLH